MSFFLLIIILSLSQHVFCSQNHQRRGFTDLSIDQALRGHDELKRLPLDQTPYFPTKEEIELTTEKKRTETPILKGSTEKINSK